MMKQRNRNKDWPYWAMVAFILAAMSYAYNAKAETEIYLGAWSKHFNGDDYNEEHRLVGINYKSWVAGRFDNSYGRETWFIGKDFRWSFKDLHVGIMATVSRGYRYCFGDDDSNANICPMPLFYIGYDAPAAPKFTINHEMAAIIGTVQF